MRDKIANIEGLRDVTTDLYIKNPQMTIEVDREKAAVYGITIDQIRQELFDAFGARQVATIYTATNDYQVILESQPQFQADPSQLQNIFVKTNGSGAGTGGATGPGSGVNGNGIPSGQSIPLSAVTRMVPAVGPLQVNHQGNQPSVTISFNLAPSYSLGQAVDAIREIERETRLPITVNTGFQGSAQVFQESLKGQGLLVLAAIFAAYVVLGILYESFIHPITIISGLPSAGVGALLVLMLFNMDLSVIAMIGIVMLVGIVKKNAIMMIDFAIDRRRVGLAAEAAIREAALLRFRPIMMTTFAAIFGTLPIALGTGAGAELRQPLGVAVVGGLLLSQLLTLFITPVVYIYLDRIDRMLKYRLEPQLQRGCGTSRAAACRRRGVNCRADAIEAARLLLRVVCIRTEDEACGDAARDPGLSARRLRTAPTRRVGRASRFARSSRSGPAARPTSCRASCSSRCRRSSASRSWSRTAAAPAARSAAPRSRRPIPTATRILVTLVRAHHHAVDLSQPVL